MRQIVSFINLGDHMRKQELKSIVGSIEKSIEAKRTAEKLLSQFGPEAIEGAIESMSLRELSRQTGLSITYLSLAKNGKCVLSPSAFLKIAKCGNATHHPAAG
jgi:hypothetical protein